MNITVFNYGLNEVRTIIKDGEFWFVLKDVCDVLGIINSRNVQDRLDEDEKANVDLVDVSSNGVQQRRNFVIINESGLYNLILRSDKPGARKFKKWVTSEVLPSIRKTGTYAQTPKTYLQALKELVAIEEEKEKLQIELDKSKEFFSIKLKNTSQAMEQDVKRIFDANYGNVNVYHIDVWRHEYPELRYS